MHRKNGVFQYALTGILLYGLLGIALGLFLIFLNVAFLLNVVFVVVGILTVLNNLPSLIFGVLERRTGVGKTMLCLSAVATVIGVLMIFFHSYILVVALGIYFIVVPLLRVISSPRREVAFREELPKIILGVVMVLLGPASVLNVLFRIAGGVVIALSILYMIVAVISLYRAKHKTGNRVFVDTTGDGKIDTVWVDVTGDGKVDSATRYREES